MRASPHYERALALLAGPEAAGDGFMETAAEAMALGLGCRCVGIVRRSDDGLRARTLAWYYDGRLQPPVEYDLAGTPCADVYASSDPTWHVYIPEGLQEKFPEDRMLADLGVVSYRAEAFADGSRQPAGHVFIMDDRRLSEDVQVLAFFRLVAQRVGAEFNRAHAEAEHRRSEQRVRDFAATGADWFWETDRSDKFTFYSGPERYYPSHKVIGMTRWEYAGVDPSRNEVFARHLEDLKARRPFRDFAYSVPYEGGLTLRFSVSGVPVFDDVGEFAGYRGLTRDMTSVWQDQLRLRSSTERLQGFLRIAGRLAASTVVETEGLKAAVRELTETVARELEIERVSFWTATPDGADVRCLDRFLASTGRHDEGLIVPSKSMAVAHGSAVVAINDVSLDARADYIRDYLAPRGITSLMDADIWREGRFVGSLVFAHRGEPRIWTEEEQVFAGFLAQYAARLIEADARIAAERRLHESEAFHRALIENAHDDFSVVGRDGLIRFHSSSCLYQREAGSTGVVGRKLADLVHADDRPALEALLATSGEPAVLRFPAPGGGWVTFELIARDLISDPVVGGLVVTWRDITERLANLEALRVAKEEAELANRLKSAFLANVSHELRTPLNAVLGFSEIIRDQLLGPIETPSYIEYANDIHDSGRHLLGVINGILDLSKIEAGRQDLLEAEVDVGHTIESCLRLVECRAATGNVRLSASRPDDLPALLADERHVRQILLNLLSNAIKFTPDGGSARIAAAVGSTGGIEIAVTDTGIGMRPEDLSIALTPFGQVESSFTRRFDGTGLGLPLTKALAELHGGTLEIESAPQRGTTVRVVFPPERAIRREPHRGREGLVAGAV